MTFKFRYYIKPLSSTAEVALMGLLAKELTATESVSSRTIQVGFESIPGVYLVSETVLEGFSTLPSAVEARVYFEAYGERVLPLVSYAQKLKLNHSHLMAQA